MKPDNFIEGLDTEQKMVLAQEALDNPVLKQIFEDLEAGSFATFCNSGSEHVERREAAYRLCAVINSVKGRLKIVIDNLTVEQSRQKR